VFNATKADAIPALGCQELAPADPEPPGVNPRGLVDQHGQTLLLSCLGQRHIFFVRNHLRGQRREPIGLGVMAPLANPLSRTHRRLLPELDGNPWG